jgi:tripartite-type tricarboxylate transporter receptor subunit TctC
MPRIFVAFAALLLASASTAQAESAADFYKGKTVRLIVGVGVGSGYDINARLLARHMQKHIPGNPNIVVQNQPGAGSLTMTNQLYSAGPFDGTVFGATFNGLPTAPLLQPTGVRFEATKINWVGSTNRETQATYLWHAAPAKTFADVFKTETVIGAQAPGSTQFDFPMLANALFDTKFKVIAGYQATPKINLAMERGEVHGTWANWSTLKAISSPWLAEKKVNLIVQWALKKHKELPDVPLIFEFAKTPEQKQALELAVARLEFGRPFLMPPGVPADRVNAMRRAFDATMKDPEFLAEATKLKIEVDPLSGEEVAEAVAKVYSTPAATVERVKAAYAKK